MDFDVSHPSLWLPYIPDVSDNSGRHNLHSDSAMLSQEALIAWPPCRTKSPLHECYTKHKKRKVRVGLNSCWKWSARILPYLLARLFAERRGRWAELWWEALLPRKMPRRMAARQAWMSIVQEGGNLSTTCTIFRTKTTRSIECCWMKIMKLI